MRKTVPTAGVYAEICSFSMWPSSILLLTASVITCNVVIIYHVLSFLLKTYAI